MAEAEKRSSFESAVFWIGSICGIILSLWTIYEKVLEPSPAKPVITFNESGGTDILIASENTKNDSIPFRIKVKNTGESIAKNVKVYLSHSNSFNVEIMETSKTQNILEPTNENKEQHSFSVGDLNPGESFLVSIMLSVSFDKTPHELKTAMLILDCDVSCETSVSNRTALKVVFGRLEDLLKESKDVYWIGKDSATKKKQVIKALDDYIHPENYKH